MAQTLRHLITVYETIEDYTKAIKYALKALRITKVVFQEDHKRVTNILLRLASLYFAQGSDLASAKKYATQTVDILSKRYASDNTDLMDAKHLLKEILNPIISNEPTDEIMDEGDLDVSIEPNKAGHIPLPPPMPETLIHDTKISRLAGVEIGVVPYQLQSEIETKKLRKNYKGADYDPKAMAIRMLSKQNRKLHFIKLW